MGMGDEMNTKQPGGYSGTPLGKKLGLKEGFKIRIINEPDDYRGLLTDLPDNIQFLTSKRQKKNIIHLFVKKAKELNNQLAGLKTEIEENGMIWVSWPKKASKIDTDIDENVIRVLALANGLVDIKVCAINEVWSGLKLVIPLKNRSVSS